MEKIIDILKGIVFKIIPSPNDSDADTAKKIIWYAFFGCILALFIVSWLIFLALTFSTETVKVPNIENENIYKALQKLSEKRLVANVNPKYSENLKEGIVFSQTPRPGAYVKKGRIINFSVSLGNISMALKDFRGYSTPEFYEFIKLEYPDGKIPFLIEESVYEFSDTVEKGKIIKQNPEDGTPIKNVTKLSLVISNGPKDKDYKVLPKFVGKKIDDLTNDLVKLEILYTFKYNLVRYKKEDGVVSAQSIAENAIVEDLIKGNKILELTVNKYFFMGKDKITSTYNIEIPKKPIPFLLEIKSVNIDSSEKKIISLKMKGGVDFPVPYSIAAFSKINVYINGALFKAVDLTEEEKKNQKDGQK
ncbi:MAG TPA: PASTA domain-containing protein [Spirochaetota bacterium]|nr:PASTA domain-containing protein [Spirochaetota bacterium]